MTLVLIHCSLNYYHHRVENIPWLVQQLFDLDEENNIPTWFSSFLLLNNACLLMVIGQSTRQAYKHHWRLLAAGFVLLSLDEVAGIHESINTAIDMNWAIPGGILVLLLGLAFIPFLLSLPFKIAGLYVISGGLYVAGVIGVELASADMDSDRMAYGFATAAEELLEMLGALLFLVVNFNYQIAADTGVVDKETR
ncbi:MAG: hypothetical protein KUG79_00810 [Pseudomonadales bacterium]|nr:hypothetical protein [Pseudomonadales bacterium]